MATLTCESCGWDNDPSETLCLQCSSVLLAQGDPDPAPPKRDAEPGPPTVDSPGPAPEAATAAGTNRCPHCDADVPDLDNLACTECLRPLRGSMPKPNDPHPRSETRGLPVEPSPHRDNTTPTGATRRESGAGPRLRLTFNAGRTRVGEIELGLDEELLIGRDAAASRCADLFTSRDNLSRRHATVGFDRDGAAWVRDEYSTNGTFVNDIPVLPGRRSTLQDGDRLRLAADLIATVARNQPVAR